MKHDDFRGKTALVTGGSTGIGRATVLSFAKRGARVVIGDIDDSRGEQLAGEINASGGEAIFQHADVTGEADVQRLIKRSIETYGRLDFAHNNAGFGWGQALIGTTTEDWDRTLDLCLKAPFLCMKYELELMIAQGGGAIVNTASMAGECFAPLASAAYSAAKAGVIHLTRYAAAVHAKDGVRINSVSPGLVSTEAVAKYINEEQQIELASQTQPIGRPIEPREIAEAVIWLCSDAAAMITGDNFHVAGGQQAI